MLDCTLTLEFCDACLGRGGAPDVDPESVRCGTRYHSLDSVLFRLWTTKSRHIHLRNCKNCQAPLSRLVARPKRSEGCFASQRMAFAAFSPDVHPAAFAFRGETP
jgi:hypothetical protein